MSDYPPAVREVRTVALIEVQYAEGRGQTDDPVRLVTAWYRFSGERVAVTDEWLDDVHADVLAQSRSQVADQ